MQKNIFSIRAELHVLQSIFYSTDLPSVLPDKSASGHMQEAPVCPVEVMSLLSMQNMFLSLPAHLSLLSKLSLQFTLMYS